MNVERGERAREVRAHVLRALDGASDDTLQALDALAAESSVERDAGALDAQLAQLLDVCVRRLALAPTLYRFARFPALRGRVLEAALARLVDERRHENASVAALAFDDVLVGLERANLRDERGVDEALVRFLLLQEHDDVRRALVAHALASAPELALHAVARAPELFPSVEHLHVWRGAHGSRLTDLALHDARVAGLATFPRELVDARLRDGALGVRLAAALVSHDRAGVRALLDVAEAHEAPVDGQRARFTTWGTLAHACDPEDVARVLTAIVRDDGGAPEDRFAAVDVLFALQRLAGPATAREGAPAADACSALAEAVAQGSSALAAEALRRVPTLDPAGAAALYAAWPALLARGDVRATERVQSFARVRARAAQDEDEDGVIARALDEARGALARTSEADAALAEALLVEGE